MPILDQVQFERAQTAWVQAEQEYQDQIQCLHSLALGLICQQNWLYRTLGEIHDDLQTLKAQTSPLSVQYKQFHK
jgi:hypothetical protein